MFIIIIFNAINNITRFNSGTYFKVKILIADLFIFYVKKNETS